MSEVIVNAAGGAGGLHQLAPCTLMAAEVFGSTLQNDITLESNGRVLAKLSAGSAKGVRIPRINWACWHGLYVRIQDPADKVKVEIVGLPCNPQVQSFGYLNEDGRELDFPGTQVV